MRAMCLRIAAGVTAASVLAGCSQLPKSPEVNFTDNTQALPAVASARPAAPRPVTGSLFPGAAYRPGFEERRARLPGDTLTVQISENISASQKSSSTIDRESKNDAAITALPLLPRYAIDRAKIGANSANSFSGKGGTESANMFTGSITATVVDVLPNGHLVLSGEKQIGVNENVDVLRFSGTVDPRLIQPGNVVSSTQIANARILSRSRGAQGEAQSIGWLARVFLSVLPF